MKLQALVLAGLLAAGAYELYAASAANQKTKSVPAKQESEDVPPPPPAEEDSAPIYGIYKDWLKRKGWTPSRTFMTLFLERLASQGVNVKQASDLITLTNNHLNTQDENRIRSLFTTIMDNAITASKKIEKPEYSQQKEYVYLEWIVSSFDASLPTIVGNTFELQGIIRFLQEYTTNQKLTAELQQLEKTAIRDIANNLASEFISMTRYEIKK